MIVGISSPTIPSNDLWLGLCFFGHTMILDEGQHHIVFALKYVQFLWSLVGMTTLGLNWRLAPGVESPLSHHVIRLFSYWMNGSLRLQGHHPNMCCEFARLQVWLPIFQTTPGNERSSTGIVSDPRMMFLLDGQLMYLAPCWIPHLQSSLFPTSIVSSYCIP